MFQVNFFFFVYIIDLVVDYVNKKKEVDLKCFFVECFFVYSVNLIWYSN